MAETMNMTIKGFTVVPVKVSENKEKVQYLYLKKIERRQTPDELKPADRTVFVGNTPAWATESDFEQAFKCCGKVEKVILQHAPSRGKDEEEDTCIPTSCKRVGYLVFKSTEGADRAMELSYHCPLVFRSEGKYQHGLARYKEQYMKSCSLNITETKENIVQKMEDFDKKEQEKEEAAKNNQPDEDGWVTVTRVGKTKGAPRTEVEDMRVKVKESRKRKRKELVNFYSFQKRDMKKKRIEELRTKFQADKSAIEKMKEARKFRPF